MRGEIDPNADFKEALRNAQPYQFPDLTEVNERLRAKATAHITHTPRQEGPILVCISCEHKHTLQYVGVFKQLVGVDENGAPILKDRKF